MKTEFVSFVAHELRSPLSAIYGYASLLQVAADRFSTKERNDMVASIANQCKRLNRMISEMLDVSRMEAGLELSLSRQPTDLAALCERVLQDARAALPPSSSHTLELRGAQQPLRLSVDADRIEQILTNLVSNAIKYSPGGGPVIVTLDSWEERVEISVSDRGMGMTPQQMSRLFQKYYRTQEAQQSGIKGTGLGLFLARRLAQAHGGTITVESEPERGTTFRVVLPRIGEAE